LDPATQTITDANPFMVELLGYSREELVGKELWEIGEFTDAEASRAAFQHLKETGYIRYEDLPLRSKTGQRREVECVGNVYGENGRQVIQYNVRDITERKRAEAAQRDFRAMFESAPGMYLVVKPEDYEIVAVSDAYLRATMAEREKIMGKRLFEVFPDDPNDPAPTGMRNLRVSLERVKANRQADVMAVQRYPVRRLPEQGGGFEERWWSPVNSPVLASGGEIAFIIYRVEDVTDYVHAKCDECEVAQGLLVMETKTQQMEADVILRAQELGRVNEALRASQSQLQAANRELDDFATIVSHDLKAPLRGVATLAKWIESDYADRLDAEGRENLAEMTKRVGRMDRMIEGILHYSRLGRTEEKPESVALAELVPGVVEDLAPPAHVRVRVMPGLPIVYGESVRLRQVFQNLIGNAIKHGDKAEMDIRVEVADGGSFWQFSIADNGPGIEERHFERIFKIFQTLATKDKTDSTGVGLALVKRIVERAGGRVWVESHPGEGSTFHFTWPKGPRAVPGNGSSQVADGAGPPAPEPNWPAAELLLTGHVHDPHAHDQR
jgi:PAS domain S-box-containing protein